MNVSTVKMFLRITLLLIVVTSVSYLVAKEYVWDREEAATTQVASTTEAAPLTPDRVVAYYFHSNFRCVSCKKIEEYSRAAIEEGFAKELNDGKLQFEVVNVEEPLNRHFIRDYSLVTKSLVLVLKDGDKQVKYKNLDLVWQLLNSRDDFIAYVQNEVRGFSGEVRR